MELQMSIIDRLKLVSKFVGHKFVQYRLSTGRTTLLDASCGNVKGVERKTIYDAESYYSFEGIPYAKPPLGELRFRAPVPAEPWEGVRDCTFAQSQPLQMDFVRNSVTGSEDCLYINVYAKKLKSPSPLPVIVWIYGGGFQIGGATRDVYGPDYFMKQDVLLVTFNYRLGALGFLSLKQPDLKVPGNAGLKDQVLALRWVRDHIASFNGDPQNVTLMGESAGAACTHILMNTEQTRGLFHRVIMQSGNALTEWAVRPDRHFARRLAQRLGYKGSGSNETEMLQFLQETPGNQFAQLGNTILTQEEKRSYEIIAFGPVVEPFVSDDCVIGRPQLDQLANAWGNDLPLIIGGTSFEGLFSYQTTLQDSQHMLSAFEPLIPRPVRETIDANELAEQLRRLKLAYFEDAERSSMELYECLKLLSVKNFWHGIHRTLLARSIYAPSTPTYIYRFDMDSPHFNHYRILKCGPQVRGVCHADDLSYMFYTVLSKKLDKSTAEYRTIDRLIGMWSSFASTGNPNCKLIEPCHWDAVRPGGSELCLNIAEELKFMPLPESKEFVVWDSFYTRETLY
ncbi:alpha-Est1 [Drosophila busckii]|uniref:carboxylesterase n=1 Tax=Drosophila busckii TaxID=30019 RepID=A0A0M4EBZ2_DROBS|nr:esterase B1 [Drosophila busckii]ALC41152.1 alpha-Est1 [Drosophila busckii]